MGGKTGIISRERRRGGGKSGNRTRRTSGEKNLNDAQENFETSFLTEAVWGKTKKLKRTHNGV